jgi:hypothetical protein
MKAKCNLDIQNKEGDTALDLAEKYKHGEFSRLIRNSNQFSNRTETQEGAPTKGSKTVSLSHNENATVLPQRTTDGISVGSTGLTDLWSDVRSASRPRDDDTMSVGSAVSSFSAVSLNPTAHAAQRAQQRGIEEHAIKRAKARGKTSLSIHFNGDEDMNDVRDEITWWGGRLKEEFEKLKVGDVIEKGTTEDRRVQVELHGSENMGPAIKDWLKRNDYFREKWQQSTDVKECLKEQSFREKDRSRRVLFTLLVDQEELAVVEGRSGPDTVGTITVFWSNNLSMPGSRRLPYSVYQFLALSRELNVDNVPMLPSF